MSTEATKSEHKVVSREEWIAARKKLLEAEKELTRRSDEVARKRQDLPWVRIVSRQLPLRSTATSRLNRPCRSTHSLHWKGLSIRD